MIWRKLLGIGGLPLYPPLQGEGRSSEQSEDERGGVAEPPPPHPGSLALADPPPSGEGEMVSRCGAQQRNGLAAEQLVRLGDLVDGSAPVQHAEEMPGADRAALVDDL